VTILLSGATLAGIDDPAVRFLKPRHNATVVGDSTIRLFVNVPENATVTGVEIRVDGRRFTELLAPPWEVGWDAGDGVAHRLEAIVRFSDGRETRSSIRTSPLTVNQIEKVDLVNLYLVVRDLGGSYISDLTRDDFRIFENDVPQRIERFTATHKPLRVGVVLDTSGTMGKGQRLEHAKKAALEFLDILQTGDEATVVTFSDFVHLSGSFSDDKEELARPIRAAHAQGGTALYDAIWKTSRLLEGFSGRRVMVLLSDGADESYEGLEPGSLHTLKEAMEQALRSEVMIFPIGLGKSLDKTWIRRWGSLGGRSTLDTSTSVADVLNDLAATTGGRAIMADESNNLRRAFNEIAEDLRHQYSIAYDSTDPSRDGKWRSLEVTVPGRKLEVVTRTGYYAPKASRKERRLSAR
jgi:VWFA-related protein